MAPFYTPPVSGGCSYYRNANMTGCGDEFPTACNAIAPASLTTCATITSSWAFESQNCLCF